MLCISSIETPLEVASIPMQKKDMLDILSFISFARHFIENLVWEALPILKNTTGKVFHSFVENVNR